MLSILESPVTPDSKAFSWNATAEVEDRAYLSRAVRGLAIEVNGKAECLRLLRVFQEMPESETHHFVRAQLRPDTWLLFVIRKE